MSSEGAGLTVLRQVHEMLTTELADVDLPSLLGHSQAGGQTLQTLVRVIEAVAPPMVAFGRRVEAVLVYLKARRWKNWVATSVLWTGAGLLLSFVAWACSALFARAQKQTEEPKTLIMQLGMLIIVALVLFAFALSQHMVLRDARARMAAQEALLRRGFTRIQSNLSNALPIQFAAAVAAGQRAAFVAAQAGESNEFGGDEGDDADSPCAGKGPGVGGSSCATPIDPCNPATHDLAYIVSHVCPQSVDALVNELIVIRAGIDVYDRAALWAKITDGVVEVDALLTHGGGLGIPGNAPRLSSDAALKVTTDELVPILRLPVTELADLKPNVAALGLKPAATGTTKSACWSACIADSGCRWAYYDDAAKQCYQQNGDSSTSPFSFVGGSNPTAPATPGTMLVRQHGNLDPVFVCDAGIAETTLSRMKPMPLANPGAADEGAAGAAKATKATKAAAVDAGVPAADLTACRNHADCQAVVAGSGAFSVSGQGVDALPTYQQAFGRTGPRGKTDHQVCWKTSTDKLYEVNNGEGVALAFRDLQPYFVTSVGALCSKYSTYDPAAYRDTIDELLSAHYGATLYDGTIRPMVDDVFARVRQAQTITVRGTNNSVQVSQHIDPQTLLQTQGALSAQQRADETSAFVAMEAAGKQFLAMYPPFKSTLGTDVVKAVLWTVSVAMLVALGLFMGQLWLNRANSGTSKGVQTCLLAGCVFGFSIVAAGTLASKKEARIRHNQDVIEGNGIALVAAMGRLVAAKRALDAAPSLLGATAVIKAAAEVERMYMACNAITSPADNTPFPTVEVTAYVLVAALFVILAGRAISKMDPAGALGNTRVLLATLKQVGMRGVPPDLAEILACTVPMDDVWSGIVHLGVALVVLINVCIMVGSFGTADAYEASLATFDSCIK